MSEQRVTEQLAFAAVTFPQLRVAEPDPRAQSSGHAAGFAAGRRAAELEAAEQEDIRLAAVESESARTQARTASALAALAAAAEDFRTRALPLVETLDASLLAAAVEIAEALLQRELQDADGDGSALAVVRRALAAADDDPIRRIRMNPQDAAALATVMAGPESAGLEVLGLDISGLDIVPDHALLPGDAVADFGHGQLDARLTSAVARVRALAGGTP